MADGVPGDVIELGVPFSDPMADGSVIEAASVIETLVHTLFQKGIPENAKNQCFEVLYLTVNKTQELRETAMRVLGMRQLRKLLDRYKATTAFVKFLDVVLEGKPTYDLTLSALTLRLMTSPSPR